MRNYYRDGQERVRKAIRERAIERAKAKIALAGNTISDYNRGQLETIVAEEERQLKKNVGQSSLLFTAALLGLSLF